MLHVYNGCVGKEQVQMGRLPTPLHSSLTGHENEAHCAWIQQTTPHWWYCLTGSSSPTSPPLETSPLARLQDPSMPPDPTPRPVAPRAGVAPTRHTCRLVSVAVWPGSTNLPTHQYVEEQASKTPDRPRGCLDYILRRITLAAAIMVGREVHTLNTAILEHLSSTFKPWKHQEPGVKPQILGWIMTPTG